MTPVYLQYLVRRATHSRECMSRPRPHWVPSATEQCTQAVGRRPCFCMLCFDDSNGAAQSWPLNSTFTTVLYFLDSRFSGLGTYHLVSFPRGKLASAQLCRLLLSRIATLSHPFWHSLIMDRAAEVWCIQRAQPRK